MGSASIHAPVGRRESMRGARALWRALRDIHDPLVPHPVRQGELDRGRPLVERPELPVVADEPYQRIA
jgi:hypothetical protein